MKKKALSLLLTLSMLLSLVPAFGTSAAATDFTGWTKITGSMNINSSGTYNLYLDNDVEGNITIQSGATVTIDLNGHVLKAASTASVITNEGTLYITDSDTSATHNFKVNGK